MRRQHPLWPGGALELVAPGISNGVFGAMSTDDAMRLVEVKDLIGADALG